MKGAKNFHLSCAIKRFFVVHPFTSREQGKHLALEQLPQHKALYEERFTELVDLSVVILLRIEENPEGGVKITDLGTLSTTHWNLLPVLRAMWKTKLVVKVSKESPMRYLLGKKGLELLDEARQQDL